MISKRKNTHKCPNTLNYTPTSGSTQSCEQTKRILGTAVRVSREGEERVS